MTGINHFAGLSVMFVMASPAEYGPALKARIKPLICGIGIVEALTVVGRAFGRLEAAGTLPDLVVSLGSAGSRNLQQGKIYQVSEVSWRDIDASPIGYKPGEVPSTGLPIALPMTAQMPDFDKASLSTGSDFVSGDGWARIDADMVDMETYGLARLCAGYDLPLLGLRGISDGAKELTRLGDWTEALPHIDRGLAETLQRLEDALTHAGLTVLTS